jgi:hypothetical protein
VTGAWSPLPGAWAPGQEGRPERPHTRVGELLRSLYGTVNKPLRLTRVPPEHKADEQYRYDQPDHCSRPGEQSVNQHRMLTLEQTAIKRMMVLANSRHRRGHHRRRS